MRIPRLAVSGALLVCFAVGSTQLIGMDGAAARTPNCSAPPGPRVNLSGCNLPGDVLTAINLEHSKFRRTNLSGAYLFSSEVNNSNFRGANLSDACLSGFCGPDGAGGQGAIMSHDNLVGADLSNAQGGYLAFSEAGSVEPGVDFADANLTSANLTDAYLTDADLAGANLKGANLTGATLTGTSFQSYLGPTVVVRI
jgi:uncharacterized protein YjbI with pentapeptide repeats